MWSPIKTLLLCLFPLLCLSPVCAADLKTYKEVYQKNSEEIRQPFQPKFDVLQQQYQKSLEALKSLAQKQGNFKTAKAAIAEIDRFQKAKTLPPAPDESEIPEIKTFQAAYVKQFSKLETEMTASLGAMTAKYGQALDRLLKELTQAGKMDEAAAVEAELAKAQSAVKDFAEQLAALKGPSATDAPVVAASPKLATSAWKKDDGKKDLYLVVDLSGGKDADKFPVTCLADMPKGGWTDEYKTDKLVLRKLEPGTFVMGSPENEKGRKSTETQHKVKLTKAYYIGVFEVTQRQWERVTGNWPRSNFSDENYKNTRPVERVSYTNIRGLGDWPTDSDVNGASFLGVIRSKTGKAFDLPTEAQWEYACRAGTDKALNSNKDFPDATFDKNLNLLARNKANSNPGKTTTNVDTSAGTAKVGSYLPNAWGLYDMHGNVSELCLDWFAVYLGRESDPKGATSGAQRVRRGGDWRDNAWECRSAYRCTFPSSLTGESVGFRLALPAD
jgi:formylglycine-generating enzyme required for sulfatase activity